MKSYQGLSTLYCFIQTQNHVMFIRIYQYTKWPQAHAAVLVGNYSITLSKASATKMLSNDGV